MAEALQSMTGRCRLTESEICSLWYQNTILVSSDNCGDECRRRIYTREEEKEDEVFLKYPPRARLSYRQLQPWWIDDKSFDPALQRRTIKQLSPSRLLECANFNVRLSSSAYNFNLLFQHGLSLLAFWKLSFKPSTVGHLAPWATSPFEGRVVALSNCGPVVQLALL